jgi:Ribbon-helix-helix protein, copG family
MNSKSKDESSAQPSADDVPELRKVTVTIPDTTLEDLRIRARRRGISVTDLIRRAISIERTLAEDPDAEIVLRNQKTGKEVVVRLL